MELADGHRQHLRRNRQQVSSLRKPSNAKFHFSRRNRTKTIALAGGDAEEPATAPTAALSLVAETPSQEREPKNSARTSRRWRSFHVNWSLPTRRRSTRPSSLVTEDVSHTATHRSGGRKCTARPRWIALVSASPAMADGRSWQERRRAERVGLALIRSAMHTAAHGQSPMAALDCADGLSSATTLQ